MGIRTHTSKTMVKEQGSDIPQLAGNLSASFRPVTVRISHETGFHPRRDQPVVRFPKLLFLLTGSTAIETGMIPRVITYLMTQVQPAPHVFSSSAEGARRRTRLADSHP